MFKATITAIALIAAAPAFANSANEQFANSIGVEPGVYSLSTMILIEQAQRDNETAVLKQLLQRKIGAQVSRGVTFDGQLAASVGETTGDLSANNLILLDEALRDGDTNKDRVSFIKSGRVSNTGGASEAKAQLAGSLNVNPANYSLAQLVSLNAARMNADNNK